jgi:hypothetical protein
MLWDGVTSGIEPARRRISKSDPCELHMSARGFLGGLKIGFGMGLETGVIGCTGLHGVLCGARGTWQLGGVNLQT